MTQEIIPTTKDEQERKKLEEKDFFDMLKPKKTINIAVSGKVMISEIEQKIIDTPAFQRLRGIRQLGTACQVYPTALHTRFDHSIGTLEMVKQMISKIRDNMHSEGDEKEITAEKETLARLYALLHDITHVPFGHMLEDELGVFKRHDENKSRIKFFLGETTDIGKLIVEKYRKEFYETFMKIYKWKESAESEENLDPDFVFIHDLVSNTACADLLDYLQRDNYFCNLDTRMSLNFLNYLHIKKENGKNGKKRVCVLLQKKDKLPKKDLITDLCRLLDDRYLIAERVYYHPAKIIAGTMLGRAIQEAIAEKEITEENMQELSDDVLVDLLINSKSTLVNKLAKAYKNRKLYRCLENYSKKAIDDEMPYSKYNIEKFLENYRTNSKDDIEKFLEDYRTNSKYLKYDIEKFLENYRTNSKDNIEKFLENYRTNSKDNIEKFLENYRTNSKYLKDDIEKFLENYRTNSKDNIEKFLENYRTNSKDDIEKFLENYRTNSKDDIEKFLENYRTNSKDDIEKFLEDYRTNSKYSKDDIEKFLEDYRTNSKKRMNEIENTISAMTDTEDGDFLVYISDKKMNLKIAKMKVSWNNEIECFGDLKKKNDVIKTRLESTQNSHKELSRIYLLVNNESEIDDNKLEQAKAIFKMLLFRTDNEKVVLFKEPRKTTLSEKSRKVIVFEEAIKFYIQKSIIPGSNEEKRIEIEAKKLAQEHGEAARNSDGLRKIFKKIAESIKNKKEKKETTSQSPNLLNEETKN